MPKIRCDGRELNPPDGATVAAALLDAGITGFRVSVSGHPRAPLCGMGVCMECRLTIDGQPQQLACQTACRDGMEVTTA